MFEHTTRVKGETLSGEIRRTGMGKQYIFICEDSDEPVDALVLETAEGIRKLVVELNRVAIELDKLNGKSTLTR